MHAVDLWYEFHWKHTDVHRGDNIFGILPEFNGMIKHLKYNTIWETYRMDI